jgi:hypothetical protein
MKRLEGSDVWTKPMPAGPYGDSLVGLIVASAERAGRPVYLASTLSASEGAEKLRSKGRQLGLATLVSATQQVYGDQVRSTYETWLKKYRTVGLDAWQFRYAPETDAGRWLSANYASVIIDALPVVKEHAPDLRLGLFHWYRDHIAESVNQDVRFRAAQAWGANAADLKEVADWYKEQGLQ